MTFEEKRKSVENQLRLVIESIRWAQKQDKSEVLCMIQGKIHDEVFDELLNKGFSIEHFTHSELPLEFMHIHRPFKDPVLEEMGSVFCPQYLDLEGLYRALEESFEKLSRSIPAVEP